MPDFSGVPGYQQLVEKKRLQLRAEARRRATQATSSAQRITDAQTAKATAGPSEGDQYVLRQAEESVTQAAAPNEDARVREVLTRQELDDVAKAAGARIVPVGGTLQAQDPTTGRAVAQLHGGANIRASDWWDAPGKDKLMLGATGQFNPVSGAIGGAINVARGGEFDMSRGVREQLMDNYEQVGRERPNTTAAVAALAAAPSVTGNLMGAAFNKAQEWTAKAQTLGLGDGEQARKWRAAWDASAKEDSEDANRWFEDAKRAMGDVRGGMDALQGNVTPEEGARRGREVLAVRGADVASVFNPTDVPSLGLKAAGAGVKQAAKVVGPSLGRAAETLAQMGDSTGGARGSMFSNLPAKVGAPKETKAVLEAAQSGHREFANLQFQKTLEALQGYTPEQAKAARDAWHSMDARRAAEAADPKVGELLDKAQLLNLKAYVDAGLNPQKYNPFHVYLGQDFTKPAKVGVSASAITDEAVQSEVRRLAEKSGLNMEGLELGPSRINANPEQALNVATDLPGVRALYADPDIRKLLTGKQRPKAGSGVSPATPTPASLAREKLVKAGVHEDEVDFVIEKYVLDNPDAAKKFLYDKVDGPEQPDVFLPGARKADSADQRVLNEVAGMVTQRAGNKAPNSISEYWRRATGQSFDDSDIVHAARAMMDHDAVTGLAESTRKAASHDPRRWMIATREILDTSPENVAAAQRTNGPNAMRPAADWVKEMQATAPEETDALVRVLNAYGDEVPFDRGGGVTLGPRLKAALEEQDLVIVMPAKESLDQKIGRVVDTDGGYNARLRTVRIPGITEARLYPRRLAMGALQLKNGRPIGGAEKLAEQLNTLLGGVMFNTGVTLGNPGFTLRNLTSNLVRGSLDLGTDFLDPKAMRQSAAALKDYRTRMEAMKYLGVGKNIGAAVDQFNVAPRAPGWMPAGMRTATEKAFDVAMVPGKVVNEGGDATVARALFGDLPLNWGADDAIRAHHWMSQVRKGVNPKVAAANTNELFINYADKSGAEAVAKTAFPFVRFYTGVTQGALALAMKQPYRFSRLFSVAQYIRNQDSKDGKALNAKARSFRDVMAGVPTIQTPGGNENEALALRLEQPMTESLALTDALGNLLGLNTTDSNRKGGSLLGPSITKQFGFLAPDMAEQATGFRLANVGPEHWAQTGGNTTLPAKLKQVYGDIQQNPYQAMALADHPEASLAYDLARNIPPFNALPMGAVDPFVRAYTGATSYNARTPEAGEKSLARALARETTGLRTEAIDAMFAMHNKGRNIKLPRTAKQIEQRGVR